MANIFPINEEGFDCLDNHPDETISHAIEVIIQIGNLYEDGIYDITPQMYSWLENAVQVLKDASTSDKKIENFYNKGKHYFEIFGKSTDKYERV